AVGRLSRRYRVPVMAVHAPCLLVTQRVWSPSPVVRLRRSVHAAQELGASTVVVHPPFFWQRDYLARFVDLVADLEGSSGVAIAVENMFPVYPFGRDRRAVSAFSPTIDPTDAEYRHYTLDISHTAASGMDALALLRRMGEGLTHVHLADGSGSPNDEHLIPGRGDQPCAQLCERLVISGFAGQVVLEVNTRRARGPAQRAKDLAEALLFARLHLEL
ncbi:MAG: sugar phosphate isomerase/epimerase family protein, partial [Sciscionella sp.]